MNKSAVYLSAGQRIAMPDMRLINAMQNKVCKRDGIDGIILFPAIECSLLQGFKLVAET